MFGEKFKQRGKSSVVIADLDAMLVEPVAFKLHGKEHIIKPITFEQHLRITQGFNEFNAMLGKPGLKPDDIVDGYLKLVQVAVPTMTKEDVEQAEQSQLASVFSLIVRSYTGELFADQEKKKTLKQNPTLLSSSQSMQ